MVFRIYRTNALSQKGLLSNFALNQAFNYRIDFLQKGHYNAFYK